MLLTLIEFLSTVSAFSLSSWNAYPEGVDGPSLENYLTAWIVTR